VKSHIISEKIEKKQNKKGQDSKNERNKNIGINEIKLIDIIFLNVPRKLLPNFLDNAQHRKIMLERIPPLKKRKALQDILEQNKLNIITAPKSLVSGCSEHPLTNEELMGVLGHQSDSELIEYNLNCTKLLECSKDNISNYSEVCIVMSNCNITQQFYIDSDSNEKIKILENMDLETRYGHLALTVFITNIVIAKIAKLRLMQNALSNRLEETFKERMTSKTKDDLININLHIAELTYMWYENTFVYPITELLAQKIYSRFELDGYKSELSDLKQTFENYINMFINREDEIAEKKRQNVFKLLTLLSGISVVCGILDYLFHFTDYILKIGTFFGGSFFIFLIVYILPWLSGKKRK